MFRVPCHLMNEPVRVSSRRLPPGPWRRFLKLLGRVGRWVVYALLVGVGTGVVKAVLSVLGLG
jgi:hypothetical protein